MASMQKFRAGSLDKAQRQRVSWLAGAASFNAWHDHEGAFNDLRRSLVGHREMNPMADIAKSASDFAQSFGDHSAVRARGEAEARLDAAQLGELRTRLDAVRWNVEAMRSHLTSLEDVGHGVGDLRASSAPNDGADENQSR
jgi:hypothetical protein